MEPRSDLEGRCVSSSSARRSPNCYGTWREIPTSREPPRGEKKQNVCGSILENIRTVEFHNLMVIAGMIVGFDDDVVGIFQDIFDFLQPAGIPSTTAGVLFAIEPAPL